MTTVFVCAECPGGAGRLAGIAAVLAGTGWQVRASGCLSGCRSGGSVAVRAPGRMAYLFGPVADEDVPCFAAFARAFDAAPGGDITDARALGTLRFRALARIPPA